MSTADVHDTSGDASVARVDMKLEVQIIPVSDVDGPRSRSAKDS